MRGVNIAESRPIMNGIVLYNRQAENIRGNGCYGYQKILRWDDMELFSIFYRQYLKETISTVPFRCCAFLYTTTVAGTRIITGSRGIMSPVSQQRDRLYSQAVSAQTVSTTPSCCTMPASPSMMPSSR